MGDACIGWLRRWIDDASPTPPSGSVPLLPLPESEATLARRRATRRRELYIVAAATCPAGATDTTGAVAGAPTECPTVVHDDTWSMITGDVLAYVPAALPPRERRRDAALRCAERQQRLDRIAKRWPNKDVVRAPSTRPVPPANRGKHRHHHHHHHHHSHAVDSSPS